MTRVAFLALALVLSAGAARAQDGRALFEGRCASCHSTEAGAPEKPGPNLAGLIGRPVAGDAAFDYSPSMRRARTRGLVWDAESLARFLADPEEMFPGLWMGSNGMREADLRAAIVAYFRSSAR